MYNLNQMRVDSISLSGGVGLKPMAGLDPDTVSIIVQSY